jgi:hypothetical protein
LENQCAKRIVHPSPRLGIAKGAAHFLYDSQHPENVIATVVDPLTPHA